MQSSDYLHRGPLAAATYRQAIDVYGKGDVAIQFTALSATGTVSAASVYRTAHPREALAELNPAINPRWKLDSRLTFVDLPAATVSSSQPLRFCAAGLTRVLLVYTVSVGYTGDGLEIVASVFAP